jgi:hypothetical protein
MPQFRPKLLIGTIVTAVKSLNKAVRLGMIGGGDGVGEAKPFAEGVPEVGPDPDTALLVHLSTLECYLTYQDRRRDEKDRLLGLIGTARNALRNAGPDPVFYKLDFQEEITRNQLLAEVKAFIDSDAADEITGTNINISPDIFFEMLLNNVKVDIISYQIFIVRYLSRGKAALRKKLVDL